MFRLPSARALTIRLGLVGVAGTLALSGASALAVHENLEFPAAIHTGTCEEPGEAVFELDNLTRLPENAPDEGEPVGAAGAQVVHGLPDDAEIDATVDDLLAEDHVLAVFNADEEIVACGPIGAYTYEDGQDLAIGLRVMNDSNFSGVAFFDGDDDDDDDDDDGLDIDVFLVSSTLPPAATPEA